MAEFALSAEDTKMARDILRKDKVLTALAEDKSIEGLEGLMTLLRMTVPGPVKLTLQWNKAQLDGWRKANAAIVKIGAQVICNDITIAAATADNKEFFEELHRARGCD